MPKLSEHQSGKVTKVLVIGDSGSGKTGSLVSLLKSGYRIRCLDFDNGLDVVKELAKRDCPDKLDNFEFHTLRDKMKSNGSAGITMAGVPDAFTKGVGLMDKWDDGTKPSEWGPEYIFVIDSLTFLSEACFNWQEALNPSAKDRRQIYGAAQEKISDVLALLTSASFNTNLIVFSHLRYVNRPDGSMRGYPTAIGEALSQKIATYFNTVILAESIGSGKGQTRTLRTVSTALVDLKAPPTKALPDALPQATGLADFFAALRK